MKAITIKQPWASLIVHGIKDIENRTWRCPDKYIGQRVLIHTSATSAEMRNPNSVFTKEQWDSFSLGYQREIICGDGFLTFAIIGSVEIVGFTVNHPSIWAEKGVYNWVLDNPIIYEKPIENVKGKLSFWDYPGIQEVKIECPSCGSIEIAVEDHTTEPFSTYLHSCNKCGHVIMESECNPIKIKTKKRK